MKRTLTLHVLTLAAVALAMLLSAGVTYASVWEHEDVLEISRLHTIDDDLWVSANTFRLNGSVTGDVWSFGYTADISGKVNGSLQTFARIFRMNGSTDGSVRVFAQTLELSGYVGRSVLAMAETFTLDDGAVIGRDAHVLGSQVSINGTIRNNAFLMGDRIEIRGMIEGNATLEGKKIVIMPPAVIQGDLVYKTEDSTDITIEPGVTILGTTSWNRDVDEGDGEDESSFGTDLLLSISSLLAAFLFGVIVVRIFRPYAEESYKQLRERTLAALATGVASVFGLIFCILILLVAIFSILAGMILIENGGLAVFGGPLLILSILLVPITSFLSVSGAVILYSGKIIVAFLIGAMIVKGVPGQSPLRASALILGLLVLGIVFLIPYLWFLAYAIVTVVGAGAIILGIRNCPRHQAQSASAQQPPPQ